MQRWIAFLLAIAFGIAAGLYYGWVVSPVEYVNTTPDTLRIDYQADFVLMIAEIYQTDGDVEKAARQLALLGDTPIDITRKTLEYAAQAGYGQTDLALLSALQDGLQNWNPTGGDSQ